MANDGNQLAELAPGDAGFKVEDTLLKNQKRFEAVNEAIQNKADKFRASRLKNAEVNLCYVNLLPHSLTFNNPEEEGFENIVGKGENACNQHYPLFPQCFLLYRGQLLLSCPPLNCCLHMLLILV